MTYRDKYLKYKYKYTWLKHNSDIDLNLLNQSNQSNQSNMQIGSGNDRFYQIDHNVESHHVNRDNIDKNLIQLRGLIEELFKTLETASSEMHCCQIDIKNDFSTKNKIYANFLSTLNYHYSRILNKMIHTDVFESDTYYNELKFMINGYNYRSIESISNIVKYIDHNIMGYITFIYEIYHKFYSEFYNDLIANNIPMYDIYRLPAINDDSDNIHNKCNYPKPNCYQLFILQELLRIKMVLDPILNVITNLYIEHNSKTDEYFDNLAVKVDYLDNIMNELNILNGSISNINKVQTKDKYNRPNRFSLMKSKFFNR